MKRVIATVAPSGGVPGALSLRVDDSGSGFRLALVEAGFRPGDQVVILPAHEIPGVVDEHLAPGAPEAEPHAERSRGEAIRALFVAERGRHSEKPEAFAEMVDRLTPGPVLELFARRVRAGWTTWGHEAPAAQSVGRGYGSPCPNVPGAVSRGESDER